MLLNSLDLILRHEEKRTFRGSKEIHKLTHQSQSVNVGTDVIANLCCKAFFVILLEAGGIHYPMPMRRGTREERELPCCLLTRWRWDSNRQSQTDPC